MTTAVSIKVSLVLMSASLGVAAVGLSCATPRPPQELFAARDSSARAAAGPAGTLDPASLDTARRQLDEAERAFASDPYSYDVKHEAYLADRKALFADANARALLAQRQEHRARDQLHDIARRQSAELRETRERMSDAQESARMTEQQLAEQRARLEEERQRALVAQQEAEAAANELDEMEARLEMEMQARAEAEQKAKQALDDLASTAAVKEDARGTVITLSGQVLFPSGKATLLPAARDALDNVAEALIANPNRNVTVEGHTDSIGGADYNLELSQRRADAVRQYLIDRGVERDIIRAEGKGEERPVADNRGPEGRANNRRVEIVLSRPEPK